MSTESGQVDPVSFFRISFSVCKRLIMLHRMKESSALGLNCWSQLWEAEERVALKFSFNDFLKALRQTVLETGTKHLTLKCVTDESFAQCWISGTVTFSCFSKPLLLGDVSWKAKAASFDRLAILDFEFSQPGIFLARSLGAINKLPRRQHKSEALFLVFPGYVSIPNCLCC